MVPNLVNAATRTLWKPRTVHLSTAPSTERWFSRSGLAFFGYNVVAAILDITLSHQQVPRRASGVSLCTSLFTGRETFMRRHTGSTPLFPIGGDRDIDPHLCHRGDREVEFLAFLATITQCRFYQERGRIGEQPLGR